jgi:phosphomannomutase
MQEPLKVSYSGVRGIWGQSLTRDVAVRFASAFAQFLQRRCERPLVVLGKDTRPSGKELKEAVLSGLGAIACQVADLGVVPSPTVQVMMGHLGADGGIIITASHNPPEWNGFKFLIGPHHIVLDREQTEELFEISAESPGKAYPAPETFLAGHEAVGVHLERVLRVVNAGEVRRRGFRAALDAGGGAGLKPATMLLERLGCKVVAVDSERPSEPTPEHLGDLCRAVREHQCDLGLAQDLDADRLALVSETGGPVGEDCTFAIAVKHLLGKWKADQPVIFKSTTTSRMVDDVAAAHGAELIEKPVGEVNLSKALIAAVEQGRHALAGEGTGGVIHPDVCFGRDSLVAIALVLEFLAHAGQTVSAAVGDLPRYTIIKDAAHGFGPAAVQALLKRVKDLYADGQVTERDGVKVRFPDRSWVQVRPSNTEPIVRLVAEAPERARAEELLSTLRQLAQESAK